LKILFVLNLRRNKSGISEQILYLYKKLIEESYRVEIVSTYGNIFERLRSIKEVFKNAINTDLIIGVGCSYLGFFPIFVAAMAAFFLNKKVVFNYHGGQAEKFFGKYNFLLKYIFRNKIIVVASDYLEKVFKRFSYDVVKINNIFEYENFPEKNDNFKWNKNILWARSFESLYQPELALRVAEKLTEKNGCEFHFFGDGSLYEELKSKYECKNIVFRGLVNREDLLYEYRNFSILLNTTLYDNVPNTIFEAGYNKLLVVSSKVGGISTTFNDDEILFVEENNIDSYVNTFLKIFENVYDYDLYRNNLHERVISFNWKNTKKYWIELLNEFEN
jgi:glycosyltransferase involved in cell wall biosynthesis